MPKKNFNLTEMQLEYVNKFITNYQEIKELANQGDALYQLIQEYQDLKLKGIIEPEIISPETKRQDDELIKFCDRGLMQIIGDIPTCGKKSKLGIGAHEPFIYPKDHPDETLRGQRMRHDDIIKSCELCKQSFTEDPRIKELIERMTQVLDKDQLIQLYLCYHPQLENIIFSAFKDCTIYCAKLNRNVNLEKNCLIKKCTFMEIMNIQIPPPQNRED